MTRTLLRAASLVAALAASLVPAASVEAVTFSAPLDPIRLQAEPGQVLTAQVRLRLNDGEPLTHFKAQVEDWWRSEDGRQSFYAPAGTLRSSCGPWVSVNPVESAVGGGDALVVRVSISIPEQVAPGGYWCALTIDETADPLASQPAGVGVRFLSSLSTGIYVSVGESRKDAQITGVEFDPGAVTVALRNAGNTPVAIEGRVEFLRPGSDAEAVVASATLPRGMLLLDPIPVLKLTADLPSVDELPSGRYLVRVVIDLGLDFYIGAQQEQDIVRGGLTAASTP